MKSLITTLLLSQTDAVLEETSLMQGLVARRNMVPDAEKSRKDNTAKLMETATKMMKNGATPDVVTFIETTITEVNSDVLSAIVDEHHRDQQLIYQLLDRFDAAIAAMEACAASVRQQHTDREASSHAHQLCRSSESIDCARSRKCEEELEELWSIVKIEEEEMRRIHWEIHGEWCVGPAPPHPGLDDPFNWQISAHSEGDETSQSQHDYPAVDLTPAVIEFRRFSVEYFGLYIAQKPRVELAWENYNRKLLECAALEETWTLKVDDCDDLQDVLHEQACEHAAGNRQCAANFGHEYHMTMIAYNNAVTTIRQLEYDRKREWETLHIVTCLLETVYTHVIHSIQTGEPCPTTESHPEQTSAEINTCHIVEESMTTNLTIDYGTPPTPPELPPVVEPPCTAQYIWDESGSFAFEIQASHSQTIQDEGLESYFTVLSAFGWAGCAAPKACTPCDSPDLIVDPEYTECSTCMAHQAHLHPGQMDWDTFKCLNGDECIRASGRCNGQSQCSDGSDETGCDTPWGVPAVLGAQECQDPVISDVQFRCADNTCTHIAGRCNGVSNCADGSDEAGCATTTTGLTLEAMTGFTATIETPAVGSAVFYDRSYTFDSLGSFTGYSFIKMNNEDKHIRHSHVQMKLRLPHPMVLYVAQLDNSELPWLEAAGWTLTTLTGVSYHGVRQTRHTDWSGELHEDHYGPGRVWQKTFTAGAVEMQGNNGGMGSYVIFAAHPANAPTPPDTHYDEWTVVQGAATSPHNGVNVGADTFNALFAACPVVRYTNPTMAGSPAVYKRHNNDYTGDAHALFTHLWARADNEFHSQFDIYPSLADARANTHAWTFCNFADEPQPNHFTVGFPRDCGPTGYQPHIWFHATRASGSQTQGFFEIYTGNNCPVAEPTHYTMVDGCLNQNHEVPRAVVSSDAGATASVRCCSMEGDRCDTDHLPGGCQSGKTYEEATAICAANGERLCTEEEIIDRVCCGTGCGFDGHQVWVSH